MAEHEPSIGQSDDWYTPREIFDALGLTFDLDPCSPGNGHWVPARYVYTARENGFTSTWDVVEFVNNDEVCGCACHCSGVRGALPTNHSSNLSPGRKRQAAGAIAADVRNASAKSRGIRNDAAPIGHIRGPRALGSFIETEREFRPDTGAARDARQCSQPHVKTFRDDLMEAGIAGAGAVNETKPANSKPDAGLALWTQSGSVRKKAAIDSQLRASKCGEGTPPSVMLAEGRGTPANHLSGIESDGRPARPHGGISAPIADLVTSSPKNISLPLPTQIFQEPLLGTCFQPAVDATTGGGIATRGPSSRVLSAEHWSCPTCEKMGCRPMSRPALVFCNPPFGGRYGHLPWLSKFLDHGNGIAIVRAYTSSSWWHEFMPRAEAILFPKGKTKFVRPDGSIGKAPGHGVAIVAMGEQARAALAGSRLGMIWEISR